MKIRLLPPALVSRIAAGEVIERPASVVKELIENALDAGASRVDIQAASGGVTLLRVSDDGEGVDADDLEAAFTRHATSKLEDEAALHRIGTLGFRGEALASMAAVADVTLLSCTAGSLSGAEIRVKNGVVIEQGPRAAPPGTTVSVRNLFRDVPARLKFLKSNAAEANRIASVVGAYALSRPGTAFSLTVDGKESVRSQGNGDRRAAFAAVYGAGTAARMLDVEWSGDSSGLAIDVVGLTSPADLSRGNRTFVTLLVNGRLVQSRSLSFAVIEAYRGFLGSGRYPMAVLDVHVDVGETDVNVHPAKMEIKFRDERPVFSAVRHAVTESLEGEAAPRPATVIPGAAASPFAPLDEAAASRPMPVDAPISGLREAAPRAQGAASGQGALRVPVLRVLGQLGSTFIISEGPEGMYLIDQHTAHERVLFDQLRRDRDRGEVKSQGLLEPLAVEMSPEEQELVAEHAEILTGYGFDTEPFGERAVLLRAVPAGLAAAEPARALHDVLDYLQADDLRGYSWEERMLASVACHSAVRAGQALSAQEMREMVRLLETADNPHACPHGRPIIVHMSTAQLEREFDRR